MKKGILFFLVAVALLGLSVAASAQSERKLSPFDAVSVTGNIEVILVPGDEEKAVIEVFGLDEGDVSVYVTHNTLRLQLINSMFKREEKARIQVTYKQLRSVKGNAGGKIGNSGHTLEADKLYVRATSGSEVNLNVKVNALDAGALEGGVLHLEGSADTQDATAATGAKYEALDLDCRRTFIRANTGGQAEVAALELLDANANTGGVIRYRGNPNEHNSKTMLSGEVQKIEE